MLAQGKRFWASRKISLPWMFVVPFVLQVLPVVGWVGYVSYRNGQASVEDLTGQMMDVKSKQVESKLAQFLGNPPLMNRILSDAAQRGNLKLDFANPDPDLEKFLWQHMRIFDNLTWISLGSEANESLAVWRPNPGEPVQLNHSNASTQYQGNYYATNDEGQRTHLLKVEEPKFYPTTRPWYKAVAHGKSGRWTDIYTGFTPGTIFIAASEPLYDPTGKFMGVSGIDISLTNIQNFLAENPVSATGQTFVMERSGLLVAASSQEKSFRPGFDPKGKSQMERVHSTQSQTPLIQSTALAMGERNPDLATLQKRSTFTFTHDRQKYFVQVQPFSLKGGLDWLIVTVVPEVDVMSRIYAGTQTTIWLCLGALAAMTGLNFLVSRWLVKPIIGLSRASRRIALGEFDNPVRSPRVQELSTLADSFNQMSQEIQQSRQQLQDYSHSLEDKVRDRTQELQAEIERRSLAETSLQLANAELQRMAYFDGLTQIANRRRFDERLSEEWLRLKRDKLPLSLILCDVDYFKRYNDAYGHQAGDDCLRSIAQALSQSARRVSDLAARYGGEEFAMLLPNTSLEGAREVASEIQRQIRSLRLAHRESEVSAFVTMSLGVAMVMPSECMTSEGLLAQADGALYQAKGLGRDQICCSQVLVG
jgi:diguanylate cyclase (GGDEF)-like protein